MNLSYACDIHIQRVFLNTFLKNIKYRDIIQTENKFMQ